MKTIFGRNSYGNTYVTLVSNWLIPNIDQFKSGYVISVQKLAPTKPKYEYTSIANNTYNKKIW